MNCIEFSRGYGKSTERLYRVLLGDIGYVEITPWFPFLITEGQSEKIVRELLCQMNRRKKNADKNL